MPEHILIPLVSGTNHHKLGIIIHDLLHHFCNQVETLLIRQAGNETDDHLILIYRQAQCFLQGSLVGRFALLKIFDGIMIRDLRIGLRIPDIIIDTIDNSSKIHMSCGQQAIHSLAVLRCLDLLGIGFTDCRDIIRVHQSAFEHIGIPLVLQLIRCKYIIRQTGQTLHRLDIPDTLES